MRDHLSHRPIPPGRSILFIDIDGTIIDSFPGIRAGFLHGLDTVGVDYPSEEFIAGIAGPPMEETYASLGLADATVRQAFDSYMDYATNGGWSEASAYEGMAELIAEARDAGFWLATASSKGEGFARNILERENILPLFDFLGAAEEYGDRRTKEKVIAYVLDSNGLRGRERDILMIGDRSHDIEGTRSFGIDTVAVEWGYGSPPEWQSAAYSASTTTELKEIIRDWSS